MTVELGRNGWTLIARRKGAQVHAVIEARSRVTYCDIPVGGTLTFEPGTKAAACAECLRRGAVV